MNAEQNTTDSHPLRWIKSSYSGSDGGDCVEVAATRGTVHVRDSKDQQGPVLSFSDEQWDAFIDFARAVSD